MLTLEEQIERIADAPLVASHDHADTALVVQPRSWFNRRSWVGVAAAVLLIGLVGALIGVVADTERRVGHRRCSAIAGNARGARSDREPGSVGLGHCNSAS